MKLRSILIIALVLVFAASAFAQKTEGQKRTIIVKDGKVITDTIEGLDGLDNLPFELLRPGDLLTGKRAFLGVSAVDLTPELREHYGADKTAGVLVGAVEDGSPAEKAGIHVGDIILSVDGTEVTSSFGLRKALREKKEGDPVRVELLRGRARQTLVASVVERDMPTFLRVGDIESLGALGKPGEWRTRVSALPNCIELQAKIKELEAKMKDLEKKLQK